MLHTCLDVVIITYVQEIPKTVSNRIQAEKDIEGHRICMKNADYDYI